MLALKLLIIWTFVLCGFSKRIRDQPKYGPQPKISISDGNLFFIVPEQKNLHFEASAVSINKMDLLTTLVKANNATKLLSVYQNSFASYVGRITDLETKLQTLEPLNNLPGTNTSQDVNFLNNIRRINRRLMAIQRDLNRLNALLTNDECSSNPCKNGGHCTDMFNGFSCICQSGWEGTTCENDVNECSRFLGTDLGCQNGATCVNKLGTYECVCPRGWFGLHCTRRKVDCNTGGTELCGHGTCITQNNEAGYKCICDQGWQTDGTHLACNTDVDECKMNHPPCSINPTVSCVNVPGSFYCGNCPQGYTGNGYYCSDIDECALYNGGCSMSPMVQCINTPGSKICGPCPPGYAGDGITCTFRGVCNVNNGGCHRDAICRDNPSISSTYVECVCPVGMLGNGIGPNGCRPRSGPYNPCNPNPCQHGDCTPINNSTDYSCRCRLRYTGRNCDIYRDPCASNPCMNGGTCTNFAGITFRCQCSQGFMGLRCQLERSGCGGYLTGENGTLSYPPKDFQETTPNGVSCSWNIQTNSQKILQINIKKFNVGNSDTCRTSWLQIHDGRNTASKLIGRFCGSQLPLGGSFTTTDNVLYVWLKSDRNTRAEIELEWTTSTPRCGGGVVVKSHGKIESPGSPGNYPNNRDCHWLLVAPAGKRFLFHFYSLQLGNNSDCDHDYLNFYSDAISYRSRQSSVLARFCNSSLPAPLYSTGPVVLITFHSDNQDNYPGFQLTYSVVEAIPGCGGVYTAKYGVIQSVSADSTSDGRSAMHCEYQIKLPEQTKLKLTFLELDLQSEEGCNTESLKIYEGLNISAPLIGTYCGNTLPGPYISLTNSITLISSMSRRTGKWKIKYETICSIKMTNATGSLDHSSIYYNDCVYEINQPLGYQIILTLKLYLTSSIISNTTVCTREYIEVHDGNSQSSALLGKYCGRKTVSIQSSHNSLWIKVHKFFHTSFDADYTAVNVGCGGILTKKIGTIAIPTDSSNQYPSQKTCSWLVIAPPGNVIQLTWMTFNLEQSSGCSYDNVQVFDNGTEGMGGLMGTFCGYSVPPVMLTSSNMMTVVFKSDNTINGEGFLASYTFIPETNVCGGNYFTPAGVIKSPGYPNSYPMNKECKWTISVAPGRQILLNITDFDVESYSSCRYDWLEIRNGGTSASPLIGKFCGTNVPKVIPSHSNKMYLFFNSDTSRTGHGFKIIWTSTATGCGGTLNSPTGSIISPHYPEPYARNTECIWKISVSAGSKVQAMFSDIDLERHTHCGLDYVELFDGLTQNSKSLGRYCNPVNGPTISSGNNLLVRFRSDISFQGRGFNLQYSTVCRNTLRGFRGVIESPNFPNEYPRDQNCLWEIIVPSKNKINITFSHFQLERSVTLQNNSCAYDYLEIQYSTSDDDEEENTYEKYGRYCGDDSPGLITLNSDRARILFVSDSLLLGSGFRLEWQLFGCGGILTKKNGTIQSPNYPNSYQPYVKCEWLIQVDFGYSIEITFNVLDVEPSSSCDYDYVQLFNGIDSTYNSIMKICHQTKPITATSTGNNLFMEFQSDNSYQGKGFSANYSVVPTKCGGKLTAPVGNIFSPNYPKNYNRNETCEWLIDIDDNHVITLEFEDIDLLTTSGCALNYVKIFDGPSQAYPVLATVCGTNKSNPITSSYNQVYIEFRSHGYVTTKGFHLKYKKACGARITTQGSGTIELSRHYEFSSYDTDNNCSWTIEAINPSDNIALTITHMGASIDCEYIEDDNKPVKIYGGEYSDSPLLGSYCGTKTPPTIFSDGSTMHISINREMDFFAKYTVLDSQCGGSLISEGGYFSTPGYPKSYPLNLKCEWTIAMAAGNHLTLNFINFELPQSDNCNTDYLEIRRTNASGKFLGVYCGQNTPQNISHTGSLWLLFKSSNLTVVNTGTRSKGFYAEYSLSHSNDLKGSSGQIASPLYPRKYFGQQIFTWTVTVAPGKAVLVTFKEFHVEMDGYNDGECYSTSLTIYDGPDNEYDLLGRYCGVTMPSPVKSKTNVVTIQLDNYPARLGSTFLIEWLEVDRESIKPNTIKSKVAGCGSPDTIDVSAVKKYNLTSPGYPNGYARDLHCEWLFSTISMNHLVLRMNLIDLANTYISATMCFYDYVEVFKKEVGKDWESVKKLCRDNDTTAIELPSLAKVVFVTRSVRNATGFSAQISEHCGGDLTEPSGHIIFNNNTAKSFMCEWNITVRAGRRIELTFEKMGINTQSANCDNYLLIRNGKYPDSPFLGVGKYCGTQKPDKLISTGNNLYVKYSGNPEIEGFQLKYQEVSTECGGDIRLESYDNFTEISSPNYPNIPDAHSECTWVIRAPSGESLQIDFEDRFDLTNTKNCEKEYVEIRNGGTEYSPLINRFCQSTPSTQFTTDNIMFVRFFTDIPEPRNGFKAKISITTCGGTIRGETGELSSPEFTNFPVTCTWRLIVPPKHYLNLTFVKLQMNSANNCSHASNYVTLSEVNKVQSNVSSDLGKYCGAQDVGTIIKSMTNEVIVTLIATNKFPFKGFQLQFNASQDECGGTINQESGVIISPGYYNTNTRRNCLWLIEVPKGRRITMKFEEVDLEPFDISQYLGIFDGHYYERRLGSIVKTNFEKFKSGTYKSSSNKALVYFWHPKNTARRGFKLKFSSNEPSICIGDFNQTSGLITEPHFDIMYACEWQHALRQRSQTFSITFNINTNFTRKGSFCRPYISTIAVVDNAKNSLALLCGSIKTPITVRSPFPIITLKAATDKFYYLNFTASYDTHNCGGILDGEIGYISSPNFPNKPTKTTECAWLLNLPSEQRIKINVLKLNLGSDCEKSFLSIYNGKLASSPRIGKYCQNNKPDSFVSQSNKLWIEYKYEQGSDGTGFNFTYEPVITGCSGIFHDKTRIIQTPGYDQDYPDNSECVWEIRSKPGYYIRLIFLDRFYIEQSTNCTNDYLEIWDWKDDKWVSMGRKCGRETPNSVNSTSDRLKLLFRSNDKITATGFKARWEWLCGGTFESTSEPQYITSPGYPETYEGDLHCVYNIKPKQSILIVKFETFELEDGIPGCKYDNVTIKRPFFPHMLGSQTLNRNVFCGTNKPPVIRNRGPLTIEFKTDRYLWGNGRGFRFLYYHESCGGDITNASVIESNWNTNNLLNVGFGGNLHPFIDCAWKITGPSNQIVVLVIDTLRSGQTARCFGQALQVYDGLAVNTNKKLATLCGNLNEPTPILSQSNKMLVKLMANPVNYKGFKGFVYFTYGPSAGCGGVVNLTETKTIESPNNLADLDCGWKIIAPRDYQIKIQFTSVNVPVHCGEKYKNISSVFCKCAFIEVRDGGGPVSELITKLCNSYQSDSLTTSWNTAYIRMFVSGQHNNVFKATLTPVKSICGNSVLKVNSTKQILTSPSYPNSYPANIKCIWKLEASRFYDKIDIHFEDFDLADELATDVNFCEQDKFEIIEDPNSQIITEGLGPYAVYNGNPHRFVTYNGVNNRHAFCGKNDIPFDYYSRSKSVILSFKSSTSSQNRGKGFKLEYTLTGCNRNYTNIHGRVVSGEMLTEGSCYINITVPENRTISLYFMTFSLMTTTECEKVGLEIREKNSTGPLLQKSCGFRLPDPVFSNTNSLWVHFYAKYRLGMYTRYDFIYTSSDMGKGCGGKFYNNQGRFTSPMYPNSYARGPICVWEIRVPTGLKAALKFNSFDIKGSCTENKVVVETYSGDTATSHEFCPDDFPAVLFSDNHMKVTYHSSSTNTGMGWVALFQSVNEVTNDISWFSTQ